MSFPSPAREAAFDPRDHLAVALDVGSSAEAMNLVERLEGSCRWCKVGMELFYAAGPGVVGELRAKGMEVFLDLKLHDIPNTVAGAVRSAAHTGASLLTVHAMGGAAMLEAAADAVSSFPSLRLLAVTVLTSMDGEQLAGIGVDASPRDQVLRLARLAKQAGIPGLVCSSEEVRALRSELGASMDLVVPGIRPMGSPMGDQRRVASPREAMEAGASMIVVGRPIVKAKDPAAAVRGIFEEMAGAQRVGG